MFTLFKNPVLILKFTGRNHIFKMIAAYACIGMAVMPAYAAQALYSMSYEQSLARTGSGLDQPDRLIGRIHMNNADSDLLSDGGIVEIPIPGGKVATGKVITLSIPQAANRASALSATQSKVVSLDNNAGSVELTLFNQSVTKMVLHDVANEKIYRADVDANGKGELRLQDNNDYYCVSYPNVQATPDIAQRLPREAAQIPDVGTLRQLQSRPGSQNVLYLDYWGGTLVDSYWNASYNSNAPINYTSYDVDNNPGSFSNEERYGIWLGWREVVEDFAPYDINITTDRSVYEAAAVTNRSKIIITTTKNWYPGTAGGLALLNSFDDNTGYRKVAWTWNLSDISTGLTNSHEAGHQLGLRHDGTQTDGYYRGHGSWGPIMGAPFGRPYTQWSKGEYPGANNQYQDDIAILNTTLGPVKDEAGNGLAAATELSLPVISRKGLIGFGDMDSYKFTQDTAGKVKINVISSLGDEGESRAANLAMNVLLVKLNTSGGVQAIIRNINASDVTPLSPMTNKFEIDINLDPGTYGLRITPNSPDNNWTTGFGKYGIAGEYRLSVISINTRGRPVIDRTKDVGVFIWENAKNNWVANIVSGDKQRVIGVDVNSDQTLTNVYPISLESSDVLTQLPNSLDLKLNITAPWVDGIKFTINNQASTCLSVENTDVPIYLGPDRVLMPTSFDLNTLKECDPSSIRTLGKPTIDPSSDFGLFIWRNAKQYWAVNAVSGDMQRLIEIDVTSDKALFNALPISFESGDIFSKSSKSLYMLLNLSPPWMDGFKFGENDNATTCIKIRQIAIPYSFPIYIGPNRIKMGNSLNLKTLTEC